MQVVENKVRWISANLPALVHVTAMPGILEAIPPDLEPDSALPPSNQLQPSDFARKQHPSFPCFSHRDPQRFRSG